MIERQRGKVVIKRPIHFDKFGCYTHNISYAKSVQNQMIVIKWRDFNRLESYRWGPMSKIGNLYAFWEKRPRYFEIW